MKLLWLITTLIIMLGSTASQAAKKVDRQHKEFLRLMHIYNKNAMSHDALLTKINSLISHPKTKMATKKSLDIIRINILLKEDYPILASQLATHAIRSRHTPRKYKKHFWKTLHQASQAAPVQFILTDLAKNQRNNGLKSPFKADWNYYIATYFSDRNNIASSQKHYRQVSKTSRYYYPAMYQLAMIDYRNNKHDRAMIRLKSLLNPETRESSRLDNDAKRLMTDHTLMAIARILYEQKQFLASARFYRKLDKQSPLFYQALYEQSWSLFMSGNPKHALGSLYGVNSPYFKDRYNPESKILETMIYYFLCRYDDARQALAGFSQRYTKDIEALDRFIQSSKFNKKSGYDLFENLISNVSGEALGLPVDVLKNISRRDSLTLVRDQLASIVDEKNKLANSSLIKNKDEKAKLEKTLDKLATQLKYKLGKIFKSEIKAEKKSFENLHAQSQFLYLELLMSEKEQLLGRELHAASKIRNPTSSAIRGWGKNIQTWSEDKLGEYWWDEIGFQVIQAEPKCVQQ